MKEKGKGGRTWWLILVLVLILTGLGYYFYIVRGDLQEEREAALRSAPAKPPAAPSDPSLKREVPAPPAPPEEAPSAPEKVVPVKDPCQEIQEEMAELFRYLDQKAYVQALYPKADTKALFKRILQKAGSRPPVPAGEGADPQIMIRNLYHFFRVLDRREIRLIKEILEKEHDALEYDMDLLYRWLSLGARCPDTDIPRPPFDTLCRYAGFFLNTTGGRAYLFRRESRVRLLVNYYAALIVNEADRTGRNRHGIDLQPFVAPLKQEVSRYAEFQSQEAYLDQLNRIEAYYMERR